MPRKTCGLCGESKPASEFYKKPDVKDGLAWACKPCLRIYVRTRYGAKFRRRPLLPDGHKFCPACKRVLLREAFDGNEGRRDKLQVYCRECWPQYMAKWRKTPVGREVGAVRQRRTQRQAGWLDANRRKIYARMLTRLAIMFGYLVEQPCEVKGCTTTPVEAHHTQYEKPLDGLRWFCSLHHRLVGHAGNFGGGRPRKRPTP